MNLFHESKKILDKDGKVNPLGPYGKSKLTGQEVATYFRKNKVSDAKVKRAVEVALDLGGAFDVAQKEIKKFFGSSILKKKEVQHALKYANEEKITEITDKEINAVKKLSKDQQAVLKDYQKITKLGDKELKDTKHNPTYKAILDARDKVLTLIGTLQTDKLLKGEDLEESIRDVEKEYMDREWVQIVRKHKNAIKKFWRTGQLDDKAEEDLVGYAMDNAEIRTDDVDETDAWLEDIILSNEETNVMNTYRKMWEDGQKYAPIEESKKMTSAQKKEFDKLYKKMDGGKEHQAIKQKIKNPIKADDAFHSLVMKKVLGEGKVHDSIIRRDFPNVWAASAKDKKVLKNFHAVVDTKNYKKMKDAYKKDMKAFVDSLKEETVSEGKKFQQSDIDKVAKLTDRNEHTKSLMHIAKTMGDKNSFKKLELINKLHNEYGHMPKGLMDLRGEVFDDMVKQMKKYDNGQDMYGAT